MLVKTEWFGNSPQIKSACRFLEEANWNDAKKIWSGSGNLVREILQFLQEMNTGSLGMQSVEKLISREKAREWHSLIRVETDGYSRGEHGQATASGLVNRLDTIEF
ncbi:unnamed protein product [Dovyalis caffra]|uniref:Uncharacterized protein n=1 Tax=Dovyalis caffra TaxID=77055 RepID=A0AAV1RWU9_9ROSI|nr:unnamed protein product [Dovyalis caffra]